MVGVIYVQFTRAFVGLLSLVFLFTGAILVEAGSAGQFEVTAQYGEDFEPPTTPNFISAVPISSGQIDLVWSVASDNFGVAGYQLIRNGAQIATTSLTEYTDSGLLASTTYTYEVRAFDISGNLSSTSPPVIVTTFAAPIIEEPETIPASGSSGSTVPEVSLVRLEVTPNIEGVRIEFETSVPVRYIIRYGQADAFADGFIESTLLKRTHGTSLYPLIQNMRYEFELYVFDRFNREILLHRGDFTTLSAPVVAVVPNVSMFKAIPFADDVLLQWIPPADATFAYVRIVRNHYFFPADPNDGLVVYEGPAKEYVDSGAFKENNRQYYTIFTYALSGQRSSGAIAIAQKSTPVPSGDIDEFIDDSKENESTSINEFGVSFVDLEIVQGNEVAKPISGNISVRAGEPVTFRVPYDLFPERLKAITVTLTHPSDARQTFSFLLRASEGFTHYEATLSSLVDSGYYDVTFSLFDLEQNRQFSFSGVVHVESVLPDIEEVEVRGGVVPSIAAVFIWLTILFCFVLLFLIFFWRRRRDEDNSYA